MMNTEAQEILKKVALTGATRGVYQVQMFSVPSESAIQWLRESGYLTECSVWNANNFRYFVGTFTHEAYQVGCELLKNAA